MGIRIHHLRLQGSHRSYDISFDDALGEPRSLSVIAGEISTGKSSVLEFIDYCLGAKNHPEYPEIAKQVRTALLEISMRDKQVVVERPLFSSSSKAFIHECSLSELQAPHRTSEHPISPAGHPDSLSSLLLSACGLAGISLKEAPTQVASGVDPLSFRDLMWLCFLESHRLDGKNLLFEATHMKFLKLQQVIDVVFDVHIDALSTAGQQLDQKQSEVQRLTSEIAALERFLGEQNVLSEAEIGEKRAVIVEEAATVGLEMSRLDHRMAAASGFADELRQRHEVAATERGQLSSKLRDRRTLLERLLSLRGQYSEDLAKLTFLAEAKTLFDPLGVSVCPSCLSRLGNEPTIDESGRCTLCGAAITAGDRDFDVQAEIRQIKSRLRELNRYVEELEAEVSRLEHDLESARENERREQLALDALAISKVAPFLSQRDALQSRQAEISTRGADLQRQSELRSSLSDRRRQRSDIAAEIGELENHISKLKDSSRNRPQVVKMLSTRFGELLETLKFPKLTNPCLDDKLSPHVRGLGYRKYTSGGALTLVSLAWQLAIFESAIETRARHPGLLMIDSVQKNLTQREGQAGDEFVDTAIVGAVYKHLLEWSSHAGSKAQIIVVDNEPPPFASSSVVVRYTGKSDRPPYGLIDDEVTP